MIRKLLIVGLFLGVGACKTSPNNSVEKVEVVNPDYGILSVVDRTRDGSRALGWRCFPIKDVKIDYRTWPNTDPYEPQKVIETMCDFEIFVDSKPIPNKYHGRRGKPVSYCNEFKAAWKKLTQGEEHICMDAESWTQFTPEEDKTLKKKVMTWTWDKIKTKKGCYSFWGGYNC